MVDDERKKKELSDFENGKIGKEVEIMDIYDDDQRSEMLQTDEITATENAFMEGREMKPKDIRKMKKITSC